MSSRNTPYFMRDQVRNQVSSLMAVGSRGDSRPRFAFRELLTFAAVTLAYLVVLAISN